MHNARAFHFLASFQMRLTTPIHVDGKGVNSTTHCYAWVSQMTMTMSNWEEDESGAVLLGVKSIVYV